MKAKAMILFMLVMFFLSSSLNAQIVDLQWNTFLGSSSGDRGYGIARDSLGNIYVSGSSEATWGSPINAHNGGSDAFVACLDSSGSLVWNTFLGSVNTDVGYGIALDSSGYIYISGYSGVTWGSPVNAHSGSIDVFIACMDSSGNLLWNTFLGSAGDDYDGYSIELDSLGNIYLIGYSDGSWGTPVNAHSGNEDAFVACLNSSGNLVWNTFLGSSSIDRGYGIDLDSSGNILVIGYSGANWGSPIFPPWGGWDAFVACLDSSGNLVWNTFLGSNSSDMGFGIDIGNSGHIYVTGFSDDSWLIPFPVNAHSGNLDSFVACLDSSGNLLWHTFLGSGNVDYGYGITLDNSGNLVATGFSDASWGSPDNTYSGGWDVFVAGLDGSGNLLWNTFLGSTDNDYSGYSIALDSSGHIYITGTSWANWGSPINPHSGVADAFVAELSTHPIADIKANASDGPISITESDSLQIRVSLNTFGSTANVDFWLAYKTSSGWYHYNKTTKTWEPGLDVTHQGALFDLNNKRVFQSSGLSPGTYRFYFGVDMNMDGNLTKSCLYYDMVKVTVTN